MSYFASQKRFTFRQIRFLQDNCMSNSRNQWLFGYLACQRGHITAEQLVDSFEDLAARTDEDFEQLLCEKFGIDPESRAAIRNTCEARRDLTADDHEDLETLASQSEIAAEQEKTGNTDTATKAHTERAASDANARNGNLGDPTSGGRFRLIRPLDGGQGGMGIVHVAEDSELGREVALKQIRSERADEELHRQKFQLEAEITGNLEHPGIVPVYGLGADHSGSPYYAMRLVSGEDFCAEINRFHETRKATQLRSDSVEFRSLVDRLIGIAQAVDYAHSRGVLHRDLKPSNVMVGRFGETLVIDWGLARLPQTEQQPIAEELAADPLKLRSGKSSSGTMHGSVLGTLGFAAPEQLNGQLEVVSVCSDIYSLGAILFQIMTGTTTVRVNGRSHIEVVKDVSQGRIPSPASLVSGLPKSLTAICMKALETQPADRYATVRDFVEELERWKADQPVRARRENMLERLGRLGRKHRGAAVSGTLALAAVAVVSTIALVDVNRQRQLASNAAMEEKKQRLAAELAQDAALDSAEAERAAKKEATELASRKQKVVEAFVAAFQTPNITDFVGQEDFNSAEMTAVQVLEQALDNLDSEEALLDDEKSKATLLFAIGTSLRSVGKHNEAAGALERSLDLHKRLFGDFHRETSLVQLELASVRSRLGEGDTALNLSRAVVDHSEREFGPRDPTTLTAKAYLAEVSRERGEIEAAIEIYKNIVPTMKVVFGTEATETLTVETGLGLCYTLAGKPQDAIEIMERTLPLSKKVVGPRHPKTVYAMLALATSYSHSARVRESLPLYQEAAMIMEDRLGRNHPSSTIARAGAANGYVFLGRYAEALPLLESAYKDHAAMYGENHPQVLQLMNNLAMTYLGVGNYPEAFRLFDEGLERRIQTLGEGHIDTIGSLITFSLSYLQTAKYDEALQMLERAEKLLREHHGDSHIYLIQALGLQGQAHSGSGNLDRATELLYQTVELSKTLLGEEAPNTFACMESLATALRAAGRTEEAHGIITEVLEKRTESMGAEDHGTLMATLELSAIELMLNNLEESLEFSLKVISAYERRGDLENPVPLKARLNAATAHRRLRNYAAAVSQFEKGLLAIPQKFGESSETTLGARVGLGFSLCGVGRNEEALKQFEQAAVTDSRIASARVVARALDGWQNLLMKAGNYAEAKPIIERWNAHPQVKDKLDSKMRSNARLALCSVLLELGDKEAAIRSIKGLPREIGDDVLALTLCRSILAELESSQSEAEADETERQLGEAATYLLEHKDELESFRRWQIVLSVERLINFYDDSGRAAEADKWRKRTKEISD